MNRENIPDEGQLIYPDLDILQPSPTNPRKHFDPAHLRELANSIAVDGVMQPIVVRPIPAELRAAHPGKELEIVAGERRFRASLLAGVTSIPAILRHLDDVQTVRIQVIENLQRQGLNPIEEAMGFAALRESGMSADVIGEQIGKSRRYVYGKLKLLDLGGAVIEALQQGRIVDNVALLIASIPVLELQAAALEGVTTPDEHTGEVMSFRQAKAYIANRFTKNLTKVVFDIRDATLHPPAGACTDCPNRLGNQPDTDPANANVCTAPPCAELKREAHNVRMLGLPDDTPRVEVAKVSGSGACNWTDYDAAGFRRLHDKKTNDPKGRTYAEWLQEIGEDVQKFIHFDSAADEARVLIKTADLIAIAARETQPEQPAQPAAAADRQASAGKAPAPAEEEAEAPKPVLPEFIDQAEAIIQEHQKPSMSLVQQRLKINFGTAMEIFRALVERGFLREVKHANSVSYEIAEAEGHAADDSQKDPALDLEQAADEVDDYTLTKRAQALIELGPVSPALLQKHLGQSAETTDKVIEILLKQGIAGKNSGGEIERLYEEAPANKQPSGDHLYALARACKQSPPLMIVWPLTKLIATRIAEADGGRIPDDATEADCMRVIVCFLADHARVHHPDDLFELARALNIDPDTVQPTRTMHKPDRTTVRFRHPDNTSLTWTGAGRKPDWVLEWMAGGGSIEDLKIDPEEVPA